MDQVNSLLDQITRLQAQNRVERDPDLRRENKKTIKACFDQMSPAEQKQIMDKLALLKAAGAFTACVLSPPWGRA